MGAVLVNIDMHWRKIAPSNIPDSAKNDVRADSAKARVIAELKNKFKPCACALMCVKTVLPERIICQPCHQMCPLFCSHEDEE
jgi:hypothetical protein